MDWFLTNTLSYKRKTMLMDWSSVDYYKVHISSMDSNVTAPIHCRGSIGKQVMLHFSKSKETNSSLIQQIFIFRWTVLVTKNYLHSAKQINTLIKRSMFKTLVSLFPFFSLITRTSRRLAPTPWPMSASRAWSSDTEYTRLWQYCTISEKSSANALTLTSVLGRVSERSRIADLPRVKRASIACTPKLNHDMNQIIKAPEPCNINSF